MARAIRNIREIENVSRIIGSTETDLQLLELAQDYNEYLNLDSEELIFALLKKGMEPKISSIFSLSEKTIKGKIKKAIEQNIIPNDVDVDLQLYLLNYRINNYIASSLGDLFLGTDDNEINTISSQDKSIITRKLVEYSYQDKSIDNLFYEYLFGGTMALITSISQEKLKRFFDYRDLCHGNNLFLKIFVSSGSLQHIDNLLKLDKNEIKQLIIAADTNGILDDEGLPDEIRLENDENIAAEKFATYIYNQKENQYATRSLFLRLKNYEGPAINVFNKSAQTGVQMFDIFKSKLVDESNNQSNSVTLLLDTQITVQENGKSIQRSFDIEKDVIRDYVNDLDSNDAFITDTLTENGFSKEDFIRIFSCIQRLYSLVKENKFDVIITLLKNNYKSAYDVVKTGRSVFNKILLTDLPNNNTRNYIYSSAEVKVNKVLALLSKYSQSSNTLMSSVVRAKSLSSEDDQTKISVLKMPELEALFGSQDVTDTKHGDSVFSPAAYLVDLLNLLKQIEASDSSSLYDKLIERRPDIAEIPLNCQNAVTLVPYIDLVIEILEQWIVNREAIEVDKDSWGWNSNSDAEILKADPDFCAYPVYDKIISNYSWKQPPFNFKNEELKLYTKAMNIDRSHWASIINTPDILDPYYDILGFNSSDKNFFVDTRANSGNYIDKILEPFEYERVTDNGQTHIRVKILELLDLTGLNLKEFEKILDSYFVNPIKLSDDSPILNKDGNPVRYKIHFTEKIELKNAYIEFVNEKKAQAFIYTMYQYQRLQRATTWVNHLLDAVLFDSGSNSIEDLDVSLAIQEDHVKKVGKIKKIQNDFNLSNNQIAALFGKIITHEYKYSQSYINWLFLDDNFPQKYKSEFIELMNGGGEYANKSIYQEDGTLHTFMQYICSVLQFDIEFIKKIEFLIPKSEQTCIISKNGIENLIRYSYLLSVFKIPEDELNSYFKIKDISNLSFEVLINAFEELSVLKESKFGIEQALYLLKGEKINNGSVSAPTKEDLHEVARKLFSIVQTNNLAEKPETSDEIKSKLIEEINELNSIDSELLELILDNSVEENNFYNYITSFIESDSVEMTIQQNDFVETYFSNYINISGKSTITKADESEIKARLTDTVMLKETLIDEIIKVHKTNIDIKPILNEKAGIRTRINPQHSITEKLLEIHKAVLFVKQAGFTKEVLLDYFSHKDNVPVNIYKVKNSDLNHLLLLLWSLKSSQYLNSPSNPFSFYKVLNQGNKTNIISLLKWSDYIKKDGEIVSGVLTNLVYPTESVNQIKWFIELGKVAASGINPEIIVKCLDWNNNDSIKPELIGQFKSLAKEVLGKKVYFERVAKLRDELREKQRDALVNYMLAKEEGLSDSSDLFSYLLIDTQMSPAVSSSRIVQSTLAIQLLIQRIQFNLEPDIRLSKSDENRWKWMSLYRVWEANRKIFLYPENWLEPELRDDKSSFFKELEKDLTSNEITKESVEHAYHTYLKKVEKIANIEYCQMFNEVHNDYSVLHVIGRSPGIPHEYFYRKFVNESFWTSWEPLGFEINSEHIAPVVINDRLIVFWLEYSQEAKEPESKQFSVNPNQDNISPKLPKKILKVQICWSEFKNEKWQEKKVWKDRLDVEGDNQNQLIQKKDVRFAFDIGDKNYLYIFYDYKAPETSNHNFTEVDGYKIEIEIFNNVQLFQLGNSKKYRNIVIPTGMKNHFQKVIDEDGNISMNVASISGQTSIKEIVDFNKENVTVLYPHQYFNFQAQAPFFIEKGRQSLLFVPVIQASGKNETNRYVRKVVDKFEANIDNEFDGKLFHETSNDIPDFFTDDDSHKVIVDHRTYSPKIKAINIIEKPVRAKTKFSVHLAYHPYVGIMRRNIERFGIEGLLDPTGFNSSQTSLELLKARQSNEQVISNIDLNDDVTLINELKEKFEFNTKSSFGIYNWEIFYHIPYMIANHFYTEGDFSEALKWMHYIFDPRETEDAENGNSEFLGRFWKFKPFSDNNNTQGIEDILFDANMTPDSLVEDNELDDQIEIWSNDPFKPHNVARLRHGAYMKATVMRYLDILIARGDQSFKLDTMESINEALQYYIIAAQILGKRPEVLETSILNPKPYKVFDSGELGNAIEFIEEPLIKPENAAFYEKFVESNEIEISSKPFSKERNMKNLVQDLFTKMHETEKVYKLYFGIPKNDKMFRYWEIVGERLFRIRHSMNIDGVKRSLSLFAPPIDPGLLASAAAAGLDIKALINGLEGDVTQYRFNVILGQALQLCGELKSLDSQLLSAYEKKDNEFISKLRASHEILLSEKITRIREKGIEDAEVQLEQLAKQKEIIDFRKAFYEGRNNRIAKEKQQLSFMDTALGLQLGSQVLQMLAGPVSAIPQVIVGGAGFGGTPTFTVSYGGKQGSKSLGHASTALSMLSSISSHLANRSGILAGHERRQEEWNFQKDMAEKEYATLDQQKISAGIRKQMAVYELENHNQQLKQSQDTYNVLKTKYTNEELYAWMRKEISELQRSIYDMTYNLAKKAERAFDFELNPGGFSKFISPSHFDTKYEGLLAGEKLFAELKEMEIAYFEQNKREYELTKQISLSNLAPEQLLKLRTTSNCDFDLSELLFDMDYPGQYMRRIKSVSLTIPAITGPYTNINAKLTLLKSKARINSNDPNNYAETSSDSRFKEWGTIKSVATSTGRNDSGVFELNFKDERYLPFEGLGAVSQWRLELPDDFKEFDYNTISDVIITLNYTAREGGESLKSKAKENLHSSVNKLVGIVNETEQPLQRLISLKGDCNDNFNELQNTTSVLVKQDFFPYFFKGKSIRISNATIYVKLKTDENLTGNGLKAKYDTGKISDISTETLLPFLKFENSNNLYFATLPDIIGYPNQYLNLDISNLEDSSSNIEDILIVFDYDVTVNE